MKSRCGFVCVILWAVITCAGATAQNLPGDPPPVKKVTTSRTPKRFWVSLSVAAYTVAALDMHATSHMYEMSKKYPRVYQDFTEHDPLARPFVTLPRPAYYACGFALTTGVNWLGYRMSRSPKWRKVWWLPQSISISANSNGYKYSRVLPTPRP